MRFVASHSNELRIALIDCDIDSFLRSSLWKLRMPRVKRLLSHVDGQSLVFSSDLSFSECENILEALRRASDDIEVEESETFVEYSHHEASLIKEKSKVGLLIKTRDADVMIQAREFADVVNSIMVRPLLDRQVWDAFFMCSMRKSANFSVPGSGKTASTLGTFSYLAHKGKVSRLVVVCPKNAFQSWKDEWRNCFDDRIPCKPLCFHDKDFVTASTASKRKELAWNYKRYNLILVNYEALLNFQEELRHIASDESMLVFDEIHKVKKVDGVRAKSALEISRDANYVIALTGTPIPNSYADIYNMLNILYPDDYRAFFGFSPKSLANPSQSEIDMINNRLQPFFCRTNKVDLGVPAASPDVEIEVEATTPETALFYKIREVYKNDPLALIIRLLQLESDPNMLLEALRPDEFDGVIDFDGSIGGPSVESAENDFQSFIDACGITSKTKRCVELVAKLVGERKPIIVWCFFKQSMQNLEAMFKRRGLSSAIINGETTQEERGTILGKFKSRSLNVLITNPHTLAESVSLHAVCHDAVYFEYGYNLVHLLQSKDRIHRLGLNENQYTQYYFMQSFFPGKERDWSLDKKIYDRLSEKECVMLEAIDRGTLEAGFTDQDDISAVFEGLFDLEEPRLPQESSDPTSVPGISQSTN